MDFEKYTDRAKGFVQSAQSLAMREGHQQFGPDHLLKVLLDDPEGMAAGPDPACRWPPGDALSSRRARARQAAEGIGRRRRPDLPRARAGARIRHAAEDRRQGRRQVRHRRAAAAGAGHGAVGCCAAF